VRTAAHLTFSGYGLKSGISPLPIFLLSHFNIHLLLFADQSGCVPARKLLYVLSTPNLVGFLLDYYAYCSLKTTPI
jgi:hypothetical protein